MRDAIVMQSGLVAATLVSVALLPVPHDEPAPALIALPPPPAITEIDRAIELACARYGDAPCTFELFDTQRLGDRDVVVVRRPTGVCGGCGSFTVAVVFRGGALERVGKLGEYGRFGNGPDAVRLRDVVGHLVIELDWTMSKGGYTNTYREYFATDGAIEQELCLHIAGDDSGAHEHASIWGSSIWVAAEGTMYWSAGYAQRGEDAPQLYAFSFPFEHGRWRGYHENDWNCVDPYDDL